MISLAQKKVLEMIRDCLIARIVNEKTKNSMYSHIIGENESNLDTIMQNYIAIMQSANGKIAWHLINAWNSAKYGAKEYMDIWGKYGGLAREDKKSTPLSRGAL
ncbi:MAG: hypothetical protein AABY22_32925 [Nanoarchaeota archaeon]